MKNIDYIIYYEHVARELESVKLLYEELKKRGKKVVILPYHYRSYINILKYKPKTIIVPFLYDKRTGTKTEMFSCLYGHVNTFNLHSEQITNESTSKYKLPQDDFSKKIYHCSWSESYKRKLLSSGVEEERIYVTGSIRTDSTMKYKDCEKYTNSILIPTSFSITFVDKNYLNHLKKDKESERALNEKLEFTKKSRDLFFKEIFKLSQMKKEWKIILRPHPYVDLLAYEKTFLNVINETILPKNIFIERKGSIQEAISKSESVIVWHSTSILEAALLNKKIFVLAPIKFEKRFGMDFMEYTRVLNSIEGIIDGIENDSKELVNKKLDNYIENKYGRVDGKAHIRVADALEKISLENQIKNKSLNIYYMFKIIWKIITRDIPKEMLIRIGVLDKVLPLYRGILEDRIEI